MKESKLITKQDLPTFTIMTLTVKSRILSEILVAEKIFQEKVLLPNGKLVNNRIGRYSVFSINEPEKPGSYDKIKVWSNGYDFFYRIDKESEWHIWPNYPEQIAKHFHLTSLDNGRNCELWYLVYISKDLNDESFNIGAKITVLWSGEVYAKEDLYIGYKPHNLLVEYGHGFGIFMGESYQAYKKLYDSLCSNN